MDPAIIGSLITGLVGIVITRTRCFMRVILAETGTYQWQAGCGLTEAQLLYSDSRIETRKREDNEVIFTRKTQ